MMILVEFGIQDGEREYFDFGYYNNFTQTDYLEGKITDREMLNEFFSLNLRDDDYFNEDREQYWIDCYTRAVWVTNVSVTNEQDIETLKQYRVVC